MNDSSVELLDIYKKHTNWGKHHIDFPEIVLDKLGGDIQTDDPFGCGVRFEWLKESNLVQGQSLVDMAGSVGYFSLRAITEGLAENASVYDINQDALVLGKLSADLLEIADKIDYQQLSLEISNVEQLPKADLVFCLNFLHHAGIHFDQQLVNKIGWEDYAIEYLRRLRAKYKKIVLGIAFKSTKPVGLRIPFHRFEEYFRRTVLEKAGWQCVASANVGFLQVNKQPSKNNVGNMLKLGILDLVWSLSKRWGLTKKLAETFGIAPQGRLGKYFIMIAE